jgi:signal transduction histidine kinase
MRPGTIHRLSGLLASALMVAAVSGLLVLFQRWLLPLRVLYILAVVPVAIVWGTGPAVLTAFLSAVAYDYLFIPPVHSFAIADWRNAVALGIFLVTAVVVGGLAARMRRTAVESGRLSEEQAALRRVATLVARGAPPSEVFSAVAQELAEQFGATITAVLRYQDDGTATIVGGWGEPGVQMPIGTRLKTAGQGADSVLRTGAAERVERFDGPPGSAARFFREAGMITGAGGPIVVEGRLWGVAVTGSPNAGAFPAGTERRIADFTELVATAIANAETQAQLIESRARLVNAADQTRQRIERDLHDGAQQRLVSLVLGLRMAQAAVPPQLGQLGADLELITSGLTDALDELRDYARGIHPAILTERGLGFALKALACRCPMSVDLDIRAEERLPGPIEVAAYYVVSEALTNAAKHANAAQAAVSVEAVAGAVRISVCDDGRGGAGFTRGTGLAGLKDRVEALCGRMSLHSPPGTGTTLRVELPLTNAHAVDWRDQRTGFDGYRYYASGQPGSQTVTGHA